MLLWPQAPFLWPLQKVIWSRSCLGGKSDTLLRTCWESASRALVLALLAPAPHQL